MTVNLKLLVNEPLRAEGYPLTFIVSHQGKRKKYQVGYAFPEHFINSEGIVTVKHPDYDVLTPMISAYKLKARDLLRMRPTDIGVVYDALFNNAPALSGSFYDLGAALVKEMKAAGAQYQKAGDTTNANKAYGNAKVYTAALESFNNFMPALDFAKLDYKTIYRYREARLLVGNTRSTVGVYLRTLRAVYNKLVKIHGLPDTDPFKGVFAGIKVKSYATTKKHAGKDTVRLIEGIRHEYDSMHRWTDLWLLMFYLGGADLIDVYFLKNAQLRKGRVYFKRGKLQDSPIIDLALHPRAVVIIEKYKVAGEYLFPWRKDNDGYVTFRRAMYARLQVVQKRHGIEMEGAGGKLNIKSARHTFGNVAKLMGVDEDLLRELMGHERDDVDNFYKDRFPQAVRDAAHFKIIE